jgi:hypothetical protein
MKNVIIYFSFAIVALASMTSCNDNDPSLEGEVWPKNGYVFTRDSDMDTVYVEASGLAVTSPFLPQFPIDDNSKKWTISLAGSGEGVYVHNDENQYWSIDSAFHPGLMVEQFFIKVSKIDNTDNLGKGNRFKYHRSGDGKTFYIESVKKPKYFAAALGHAESGRGLLLRKQDNGDWEFWVGND